MYINGRPTLRILFIEDSDNDVELAVHALREEYHVVWHRVENEASLVLALRGVWDVILCDYNLPHMSAEHALDVVQSHQPPVRMPFIIISGVVDEKTAMPLIHKGARDFINKSMLWRLPLAIRREIRHKGELMSADIRVYENQDEIIEAWGLALELRDVYTQGHTLRVSSLSLRFAKYLGLPEEDYVNINRGALLHDIGKMAIPDIILFKQGPLDFEEMEIMKKHPAYAYAMLRNVRFLRPAVTIPYCHHERWNGSGYPQGLFGANNPWPDGPGIPLYARMFAIIDVYDALTTERPYRESWEKSKVIAYMLDERGISFDPELMDAFVELVGRG